MLQSPSAAHPPSQDKLEKKAHLKAKGNEVQHRLVALLVAIPHPGTGRGTALIAAPVDAMPLRKSISTLLGWSPRAVDYDLASGACGDFRLPSAFFRLRSAEWPEVSENERDWQVLPALLAAVGLLAPGWLTFGRLLTPVGAAGRLVYAVVPASGDGAHLEQDEGASTVGGELARFTITVTPTAGWTVPGMCGCGPAGLRPGIVLCPRSG